MSILKELEVPVFAAEGVPKDTDAGRWRLRVDGMAAREAELGLSELRSLPPAQVNARLTSVSGWSVRAQWEGVLWKEFTKLCPPGPDASHVTFTSAGGYETTLPLSELQSEHVLLCWAVNGAALEAEYGGPLRMVVPHLWGYKSCKWVVRITYTDGPAAGYWESRGYSDEAEIEEGTTLDVNTRTRRKIRGGEVTEF